MTKSYVVYLSIIFSFIFFILPLNYLTDAVALTPNLHLHSELQKLH
jgi:hypothetical protein